MTCTTYKTSHRTHEQSLGGMVVRWEVPTPVHIPTSDSDEGSVLLLQSLLILLPPPPHSLIGKSPFGGDVLDGRSGRGNGELLEESGPVDLDFRVGVVRTPQPRYITRHAEL